MKPFKDWEATATYDGSSETITPGGHVCRIIGARIDGSREDGGEALVMALEIAEGSKEDGICQRLYQKRIERNSGAKWPCAVKQYTMTRDKLANPFFKGLIQCVMNSNPGFHWNWDESALKDKLIGYVFGEEEFIGQDGNVHFICRPKWARSVDQVRAGIEPPERKKVSPPPAYDSFPTEAPPEDDDMSF